MLKVQAEVYSRICGYFRPVNQWNKGKQEEFTERKYIETEEHNGKAITMRKTGDGHGETVSITCPM